MVFVENIEIFGLFVVKLSYKLTNKLCCGVFSHLSEHFKSFLYKMKYDYFSPQKHQVKPIFNLQFYYYLIDLLIEFFDSDFTAVCDVSKLFEGISTVFHNLKYFCPTKL